MEEFGQAIPGSFERGVYDLIKCEEQRIAKNLEFIGTLNKEIDNIKCCSTLCVSSLLNTEGLYLKSGYLGYKEIVDLLESLLTRYRGEVERSKALILQVRPD